ncbi:disease resistance protein RML1B-like [Bidens hawaiensis]|uniref:disease resistance protein RML1B-like n=1 Tax=Bidens hawaiensis TaxID=980011 RepID=UPI00404A5D3D
MSSSEELKHLHISFQHISSATNEFAKKNILGSGAFGKVYKGKSEKYGTITVKRWDREGGEALKQIMNFKQRLIFIQYGEKILVYKYDSNRSLANCLWSAYLTWTQRLQICLGAARGLKYLHHDVTPEHRMIRRNVMSANILLDEKWNAKISDFGLSKNGTANEQASFVISKASGTLGYTDPEYFSTGYLTQKSDVFSFGVILFEVLSGRSAIWTVDGQFFSVWVKEHYIKKRLDEIIHYRLHAQINPASLLKFSAVAYRCLKTARECPTMAEVVEQLQKTHDIQLAPSGESSDLYNVFTAANYYQSIHFSSLSTAANDGPSICNDYGPITSTFSRSKSADDGPSSNDDYDDDDDDGIVVHSSSQFTAADEYSVYTDADDDDYDTFELDYFSYQSYLSWLSSTSSFETFPSSRRYDVFLSFRGQDTRMTFVKRLYSALAQQRVYKDELIPRGESIGPSLFKAIQESKIAIIIFSINYADSDWCLNELEYIMKCRAERGLVVIPVFYHVDPSDVRRQKRMYAAAFSKHELENFDKVASWRKALVDAANIAGFVVTGNESRCIQEVVETISQMLYPLNSSADESLIGVESRVKDLKSKLQVGSGGVLMIGIWGVGGGGKTTLASSVYNEIRCSFRKCCFVENIREESRKNGWEILKNKMINVGVEGVRRAEGGRFNRKSGNVLIVLDDVDHLDQLNVLAGSHDWFGEGSRIIITTREKHLLDVYKVNVIHHISLLDGDEAIKLFCKYAPRYKMSINDYKQLSNNVVSYASGLPLALKVLGCFLYKKTLGQWNSALERLKKRPQNDIVRKLKISYDGLEDMEKDVFLDIACFLKGEKKGKAMEILDACNLEPDICVKVLLEKALITILDGKFDMHDLVQEIGHYIVRGKHYENPEKHSRVWQVDDVTNICAMDATTKLNKIKAIRIISDMHDPLPRHNHHVVANMKELRWIDWRGPHASSLPTNFQPRKLCCLILSGGRHRQLWNDYKYLPNLKMIKLHDMKTLITTPNFGGLPNLERFILDRCPCLEKIHPSIERLQSLAIMLITGCDNLKTIPSIEKIKSLDTLSLSYCSKLSKSGKQDASYKQYSTNFFVSCLPCCWGNLDDDSESVEYYLEEPFLLHKGMHNGGLQFNSEGLKKLFLRNCHLEDEDINSDVWQLLNLEELDLSRNLFLQLNLSFLQLARIKLLDVSSCNNLRELSNLPSSIAVLRADYCYKLETVGDISNCKWLWKVSFLGKNKLGPIGDKMILKSLLQGNAIEHHFLSLALEHQIRTFYTPNIGGSRFILHLPCNWYKDFCGFLIYCVIEYIEPLVMIVVKEELDSIVDCYYQNKSLDRHTPTYIDRGAPTYVGYVSFGSLSNISRLNPACNMISFSSMIKNAMFDVELVPRLKSKGANDQAKSAKLWDEEREDRKTFTIERYLESAIKILWCPC